MVCKVRLNCAAQSLRYFRSLYNIPATIYLRLKLVKLTSRWWSIDALLTTDVSSSWDIFIQQIHQFSTCCDHNVSVDSVRHPEGCYPLSMWAMAKAWVIGVAVDVPLGVMFVLIAAFVRTRDFRSTELIQIFSITTNKSQLWLGGSLWRTSDSHGFES